MRSRGGLIALGAVAAVAVQGVVAALVIASGVVDVGAASGGGLGRLQDRILGYASTRAIAHHAKDVPNPLARDPAAARAGLVHYRAMCVNCHGGPGVHPAEFAAGLHPPAPDLASSRVQSFSDGMLYEVVARGVGSTGMPAFGATHSPQDVWSIVSFVRRLPALAPEERQQLAAAQGGGEEHEHAQAGHHEHEHAQAAHEEHEHAHAQPEGAAPPAPGAGHHVHHVSISNFEFRPADVAARPGDVVEWKNEDFTAHTATAQGGGFDTGDLAGGATGRIVVEKKGRFPYFCRYHLAMKGTITVE